MSAEVSKFSKVSNTQPDVCVDTSLSHSSFKFLSGTAETEPVMLSRQNIKMLGILEDLKNTANANFTGCEHNTYGSRMKGYLSYFCLDTVFNLYSKVVTEDEIKAL